MKNSVWSVEGIKNGISSPFLTITAVVALAAVLLGGVIGILDFSIWGSVIAAVMIVFILLLRLNELAATLMIAVHLYFDWYLGIAWIAPVMTFAFLLIFLLARSPQHPWIEPRALWLWILFLVLASLPAIRGISLLDGLNYYVNIIFSALSIFWLGLLIGRDTASVRRFFTIISVFGTLIAIHAIIQAATGIFLLASPRYNVYLASVSNFELISGSGAYRAGSFFVNPDSSGAFFGFMLLIPLGLLIESSSFFLRIFHLVQVSLIVIALLFTYSVVGWVGAMVGIVTFIVLVGRTRYRVLLLLLLFGAAIAIFIFFPSQVVLLYQHTASPKEFLLRTGAWQTGLRVIQAFPLTGIGLGRYVYIERANPYRVPAQYFPLYHPHNSYLELAALGGLPVLIIFLALLSTALWMALRNWILADMRTRSLLAGSIAAVIALSANSMANPAWTLAPLAAMGWLMLGVISSPLLTKSLKSEGIREASIAMTNNAQ